jgi:hypothetical protein
MQEKQQQKGTLFFLRQKSLLPKAAKAAGYLVALSEQDGVLGCKRQDLRAETTAAAKDPSFRQDELC